MGQEDVRGRLAWARPPDPVRAATVAPASASDPGPPPVTELVVTRPAPVLAPPADLPSRLAQALELLEAPLPPVRLAGAGAPRRANKLGHALEQARAALPRAAALAG